MRPEKNAILQEITKRLESADYVFVLNYGGLKVSELTALRRVVAPLNAKVQVVKNTYLDKVAQQLGWESVAPFLVGPTAVVVGKGDACEGCSNSASSTGSPCPSCRPPRCSASSPQSAPKSGASRPWTIRAATSNNFFWKWLRKPAAEQPKPAESAPPPAWPGIWPGKTSSSNS